MITAGLEDPQRPPDIELEGRGGNEEGLEGGGTGSLGLSGFGQKETAGPRGAAPPALFFVPLRNSGQRISRGAVPLVAA
jgi:hypothetical protein